MRNLTPSIVGVAISLVVSGCAWVSVTDVSKARGSPDGLRVYTPRTYVVVSGSTVSTVTVPDCSREYAIDFGSFMSKHDVEIELESGMVKKLTSKQDSTAVPTALIGVVNEALKAGAEVGDAFGETDAGAPTAGDRTTLGIFEADCRDGTLRLNPTFAAPAARAAAGEPMITVEGGGSAAPPATPKKEPAGPQPLPGGDTKKGDPTKKG